MTLQEFINLCADEDILLDILDDETGDELLAYTWLSESKDLIPDDIKKREVQCFYHTKDGRNLVMEIYVK